MEERSHVGILNKTGERVAKDNDTTPKSITDEFLHDPGPTDLDPSQKLHVDWAKMKLPLPLLPT